MRGAPIWAWGVFVALVAALLASSLFANRGERGDDRRRALRWSLIWAGAGLGFGGVVWFAVGSGAAQQYLAAWVLELSLSLDNLFVFLLIFQSLGIESHLQRRVLFWGVIGAVALRLLFLLAGTAALERWSWLTWVFSATLAYAAWRALRQDPAKTQRSPLVDWLSRHLPVTERVHGQRFTVREGGRLLATPLLLGLVAIDLADVVFAIDSIPAALSVSDNFFVIASANVLAVLGMRSLYLLLAGTIGKMRYLHYGLAAVLAFTAFKLGAQTWIEIPPWLSVGFIVAAIGAAVLASRHAPTTQTQAHAGR